MKELNFEPLKANQIEVRPTDTKYKGKCTLLLYIDSRCAADIMNETVGPMNWQMEYKDVAGLVYGRLSIWDDERKMWVYKEDTGSESNIEAQKGQSSDILKRCIARWGCDYLYHTPKIKITCPENYYYNDKMTMTFSVREIMFVGKECVKLVITDMFGNVAFDWTPNKGNTIQPTQQTLTVPQPQTLTTPKQYPLTKLQQPLNENGMLQKRLYLDIMKSETTDKLKEIYNLYPELNNHKIFLDTLSKRKEELAKIAV